MGYKMIVLDMDGTLLNRDKQIPQENIQVLSRLHRDGIEIVIATGRRYLLAKPPLDALPFSFKVVSNNGGCLWEYEKDRQLFSRILDSDVYYTVLARGHEEGLTPILHVDHFQEGYDYYTEYDPRDARYHDYIQSAHDRHKVVDLKAYSSPRVMVMCYIGEPDRLQRFSDSLHQSLPDALHTHIVTIARIGHVLEVTAREGTKWHTVLYYANSLGIRPKDIIAIGDDNNDLPMIQNAGLGIAMKNATALVKEAADRISTWDNDQAGVAHVLKEVFRLA